MMEAPGPRTAESGRSSRLLADSGSRKRDSPARNPWRRLELDRDPQESTHAHDVVDAVGEKLLALTSSEGIAGNRHLHLPIG